jgi:DNA-directed RNA polymerase subunit alpha
MISYPQKPKIVEQKGNWAKFEIEALYPGYGVTMGNSLRRVLLSSLPGAAVTRFKIKNVPHEFSTIPGVLEDVILIMQNLKQMRFKLHGDEPQKASLKVKGDKKIKGSDFDFPSQIELINKDCPIATVTQKSTEFEMEIQVERGTGYVPSEKDNKEKSDIGSIPLDAIFTPVKRVSFKVENMRVGKRTDFDRLFLEIETDGTITPEEAVLEASEILVNHFALIVDEFKTEELKSEDTVEEPKVKKTVKADKKDSKSKSKKNEKKSKNKKI